MPGADEPEIAFGPYRMDQRNRSLTREGVAVPLGGRAFDTLSVLAAASGATVGKEALLDAVWPGLTVEENNLQVQISALRKALGEGWIVTVPGRGYRLAPPPSSAEPPAAPTLPDRPSIAVLPFANLSDDSDQEYFADGVVEDIITALSRTGWLFVIARNSSFTYKGRAVDVKQVGRELGVRYVLEGGVRKAGNRVRITGQLIDAASGGHVWADRFDGELADIFELQDRVTESVVGAIEPSLRRAEIARALAKPTNSLDAYDLYLRALQHYYTMTRDGIDAAIGLLRRALVIDPRYARARALMAYIYSDVLTAGWHEPGDAETALAHAREAMEGADDDPQTLCMAGFALAFFGLDYEGALTALKRALELHPHYALALCWIGWVQVLIGDPEPAIECCRRAMRISPRDQERHVFFDILARAHLGAERNAEAEAAARQSIQLHPKFVTAHRSLIVALVRLRRIDEARAVAARLLEINPGTRVSNLLNVSRSQAAVEEFRAALCLAGLPE